MPNWFNFDPYCVIASKWVPNLMNKLPKICFLYTCYRTNKKKQSKFDGSLQPARFTVYSLMTFPFKTFLTDNLKTYVWTYLFIIAHLNGTKHFHIISSKNLYGEFYARTAPGFWAPPILILSKMSLLIFQKMYCQQCPSLLQQMLLLIPWKKSVFIQEIALTILESPWFMKCIAVSVWYWWE